MKKPKKQKVKKFKDDENPFLNGCEKIYSYKTGYIDKDNFANKYSIFDELDKTKDAKNGLFPSMAHEVIFHMSIIVIYALILFKAL